MPTLYEVVQDYLTIQHMMEDPDLDPQTLADTMEGIEGELEVKADGYAKVIRNMEADIEAIKSEVNRLTDRRKTIEKNIQTLKLALQKSMEITGKTKFKTELFSFGIRNNAPSVIMDETDIRKIPSEYLRIRDPEVDKSKLKDALKNGIDLSGVAHLESSTSLSIK